MATKKIGDTTRAKLMEICKAALIAAEYDVLQVASGSFGIPAVEDGEETAIKIVFQIPKGERNGAGYDVYEDEKEYRFKREQKAEKEKKKNEKKEK
jgi:hypothetical protein